MATTDTAQALIETPEKEAHFGFCEAGVDYADLQRMAKLWLTLPTIARALEYHDIEEPHETVSDATSTKLECIGCGATVLKQYPGWTEPTIEHKADCQWQSLSEILKEQKR